MFTIRITPLLHITSLVFKLKITTYAVFSEKRLPTHNSPMSTPPNWLAQYPAEIPHHLPSDLPKTMVDVCAHAFAQYPQRVALQSFGKTLRYEELDQQSQQFAGFLQFIGIQAGDRVALMMPNLLQYPIALLGILRCGAVVVNINPLYTARELALQLQDSGAKALIILENFVPTFATIKEQVPIEHIVVTGIGDRLGLQGLLMNFVIKYVKKMIPPWELKHYTTFNAALHIGRTMGFSQPTIRSTDIAFLQYTGGTTGVSKGAILEHRQIVANLLQIEAWLSPALAKNTTAPLTFICALPLYHIFALTACGLFSLRRGGLNVLITNPRDIPGFVKTLAKLPAFHIFPAVNTLFNALLQNPQFTQLDFSHLLVSVGGGMAVQSSVAEAWHKVTGSPIIEGYGLSETAPVACCNLVMNTQYTGHVGLPLPSTEVSIRDDSNIAMDCDQLGEICIRGPQVMTGYWRRDAETKEAFTPDGFFKSGDIGLMTQTGCVKIIDRKKDMIIVSGFNVYPSEVEEVIAQLPAVLECAVIGVQSAQTGEEVKAFIVRKDDTLTAQAVLDYCARQLTNYKRPKQLEFVSDLPKSHVGKILRKDLRKN